MSEALPKVQFTHLYQFLACSGLLLIVLAIYGFAEQSHERRTTANQITMSYDASYREDITLQLKILQADGAGKIQERLNEYSIRRQAEVSTERRAKLKENTAASQKAKAYYRGALWAGMVILGGGIGLWYFMLQRHYDRVEKKKAEREERKARVEARKRKERKSKAAEKKSRLKPVPVAA